MWYLKVFDLVEIVLKLKYVPFIPLRIMSAISV